MLQEADLLLEMTPLASGLDFFSFFFFFTLVNCGLDFHTCKYNECSFEFFFNATALINFSLSVLALAICSCYTIFMSNFY